MIKCNSCGKLKPESEFYLHNKSRCKKCIIKYQKQYQKEWRRENPNYQKNWRENHPNYHSLYVRNYRKLNIQNKFINILEDYKEKYIELRDALKKSGYRKCSKCGYIKPLSKFNWKNKKNNILKCRCKDCEKEYYSNWYKKNNRNRNEKSDKVRWLVKKAKDNGEIIPSKYCEICGTNADIRAHHYDYSKPLDVIWVCRSCHRRIHAQNLDKIANISYIKTFID